MLPTRSYAEAARIQPTDGERVDVEEHPAGACPHEGETDGREDSNSATTVQLQSVSDSAEQMAGWMSRSGYLRLPSPLVSAEADTGLAPEPDAAPAPEPDAAPAPEPVRRMSQVQFASSPREWYPHPADSIVAS